MTKRHKTLVKWLREQRKASGLKQGDLAKELRKYQSSIAQLESGQRRIDVIEFLVLGRIIGFDAPKMLRKLRDEVPENSK